MKRLFAILLLAAASCSGATVWMESGGDATRDTSFYSSVSGTGASIDSSVFYTGGRSLKVIGGANTTLNRTGILADAGRRISFRWRTTSTSISGASTIPLLQVCNSSAILIAAIVLENPGSGGVLSIAPTGVTHTYGTRILQPNQWYRIAFSYTITNSTTFEFRLYIDGKLEGDNTGTGTLTTITSSLMRLQNTSVLSSSDYFNYDDIYVDNGTDLSDPGNIIVTNKRPNASGALVEWTTQIGSGGSGYGTGHSPQVNEQPLSVTNGWSIASASLKTEEYTIEGASTGDIDVSNPHYQLVDYLGWVHMKVGSDGTRNIIVNGSATNVSATTTATTFVKAAGSATYPSGNTAIGMNNNSVNNLTSLYECGILLAYKLPRRVSVTP
jgi:hypothetical protein